MASAKDLTITTMLLCVGSVALAQEARDQPREAGGRADPPHVLTETIEYCRKLAAELEQRGDPAPSVAMLISQGARMCDEGHLAGGLVRLRHAFLLTHPNAEAK